jgi:hypothetical protein
MDDILRGYLEQQYKEGMELATASDLLELVSADGEPSSHYLARFTCKGLARSRTGVIEEAVEFGFAINIPDDYLRRVDPLRIVAVLGPDIWHPNIRTPFICLGHVSPGTPLVGLLYQLYEIVTYHNYAAHDALNPEAAAWARENQYRFPLDHRPLKRSCAKPRLAEAVRS